MRVLLRLRAPGFLLSTLLRLLGLAGQKGTGPFEFRGPVPFWPARVAKACLAQFIEAALPGGGVVERPHHQAAAAVGATLAAEGDELDRLDLARLEAHGRAGRQVEPHAVGRLPIEDQR